MSPYLITNGAQLSLSLSHLTSSDIASESKTFLRMELRDVVTNGSLANSKGMFTARGLWGTRKGYMKVRCSAWPAWLQLWHIQDQLENYISSSV